jgi:hypothetical protein
VHLLDTLILFVLTLFRKNNPSIKNVYTILYSLLHTLKIDPISNISSNLSSKLTTN